jgi:hypothetical protein
MTDTPRKNATNTRGKPFKPGNAGRPRGARNRATLAAEALLDGEAEALTRKAIALALDGNILALRLCLERLLPPRREHDVVVSLPELHSPRDAGEVSAAILHAATTGEITLGEAAELARLVAAHVAALKSSEQYDTGLDYLLR